MQSIEHSGELKVGVPGDYAPLAFRNAAGELQGYDVDMARDLGRTLGLKVSFVYQLARARRRSAGGQV